MRGRMENQAVESVVEEKVDILFVLIAYTCVPIICISVFSMIAYLFFGIILLFQWSHINNYSQLAILDKIYLNLADYYLLYSPLLLLLMVHGLEKEKKFAILPAVLLLACIIFICWRMPYLNMSER